MAPAQGVWTFAEDQCGGGPRRGHGDRVRRAAAGRCSAYWAYRVQGAGCRWKRVRAAALSRDRTRAGPVEATVQVLDSGPLPGVSFVDLAHRTPSAVVIPPALQECERRLGLCERMHVLGIEHPLPKAA